MSTIFRCMAMLAAALSFALAPAAATNAAAASCEFRLGFATLHAALPARIGDCVDNEAYNAIGDSLQHAMGGLLVWRHADNWTAFTDGYRTWINGPYGIEERLNTDRFPWEGGGSGASASSTTSVSTSNSCTAVAQSGSVSAVGLNTSTVITGSGSGDTTVLTNHSTSTSSPGVTTTAC